MYLFVLETSCIDCISRSSWLRVRPHLHHVRAPTGERLVPSCATSVTLLSLVLIMGMFIGITRLNTTMICRCLLQDDLG